MGELSVEQLIPGLAQLSNYYNQTFLSSCDTCDSLSHKNPVSVLNVTAGGNNRGMWCDGFNSLIYCDKNRERVGVSHVYNLVMKSDNFLSIQAVTVSTESSFSCSMAIQSQTHSLQCLRPSGQFGSLTSMALAWGFCWSVTLWLIATLITNQSNYWLLWMWSMWQKSRKE